MSERVLPLGLQEDHEFTGYLQDVLFIALQSVGIFTVAVLLVKVLAQQIERHFQSLVDDALAVGGYGTAEMVYSLVHEGEKQVLQPDNVLPQVEILGVVYSARRDDLLLVLSVELLYHVFPEREQEIVHSEQHTLESNGNEGVGRTGLLDGEGVSEGGYGESTDVVQFQGRVAVEHADHLRETVVV